MRHTLVLAFAALTALSCGSTTPRSAPAIPASIRIEVTPVSLDSTDPGKRSVGSFVYAGGIELRAATAGVSFELSDLRIVSGDHLVAVSDAGDHLVAVSDAGKFFEARLLFNETGRLSGLADARLIPFLDERGGVLQGPQADAEGVDILPTGDRLVSFERDHRIWLYPADGSAPRPVAKPDSTFPANEGMESLTRYPAAGSTAYLVGSEGGTIWLCSLSGPCSETDFGLLVPKGLALTSLSAYGEDGAFAMLARSYDPRRGVHISVRLISTLGQPGGSVLDEMTMAAPLTVDNFEGIAVVPRSDGGLRLYLVSDDNGSAAQHTYLLAFDWQPNRVAQDRTIRP